MLTNTTNSPFAKVSPLPWNATEWTHGFWADAFLDCVDKTVPHLQNMFEAKDISHVVENFRICAGESEGGFDGTNFGDGDFYKWMESAMYSAGKTNNQALFDQLDAYIDLIGRAQLEDGYISTKQILGERSNNGIARLGDINDFEVYNFGHLFTAACLYKQITSKDNFLKIAVKAAKYLDNMYQENARSGEVQTAVCPSHYMGLIEMYRTIGDKKYLELAKLAIELRDSVTDGTDDNQDRIALKEHEKIVGHAVRSNYLYAGVADLCAETGDKEYLAMLDKVWRNLVDKKIYITGGCGALYNGTSPYGNFFIDQKIHQAYGYEYQLPNITAYNETCASIGSVFWAYRMFQLDPKAEYFDILERTMLNVNLAAVSIDGKKFFYENMLRRAKKLDYELIWPLTRSEYILSYCCPPNLARTICESSEYAYTASEDTLWIGMYGASKSQIKLPCGAAFRLVQETNYPYEGAVALHFEDVCSNDMEIGKEFFINIRIPGWVKEGHISYNGETIPLTGKNSGTYIKIAVIPDHDSVIELFFDMTVRYTTAHALVEETNNQAALERGPLVYCIEESDAKMETLDDLLWDLNAEYKPVAFEVAGRAVTALEGDLYCMDRTGYSRDSLYQTLEYKGMTKTHVRLIPYFAWDNRGVGEMKIWMPVAYK